MIGAVAWLGVLLLLVVTGFETDLTLVRRLGRATARVAVGQPGRARSLFGLAVGFAMPDALPRPGGASARSSRSSWRTALGISALPVLAAVLSQLGLMRRSIAQVMIAAAMVNDLVGWMLLGIAARLAQSGERRDRRARRSRSRAWRSSRLRLHARTARRRLAAAPRAPAHRRAARRAHRRRWPRRSPPACATQRSGSRRCSAPSWPASCSAARSSSTTRPSRCSTASPARSSRRSSSRPPACASISACSPMPQVALWGVRRAAGRQRLEVRGRLPRRLVRGAADARAARARRGAQRARRGRDRRRDRRPLDRRAQRRARTR